MSPSRGAAAVLAIATLVFTAACGPAAPPPATPAPVATLPPITEKPEPPPLLVEYVVIHQRWVQKHVPAAAADVKAWSEDAQNRSLVGGAFRHILFKVKADAPDAETNAVKKKADGVLGRVKKGEDFAKLAKQFSEDPGSKDKGGEYEASQVENFVAEVKAAYEATAPGETAAALVKSSFGFHIVQRGKPNDDQLEKAFKKAKAPDVAKKLADEIQGREKTAGSARAAIAEAVEAVLGERASADPDRPTASLVERERIKQARLPAAAKAAIETFAQSAHPGDTLPSPAVDGDTIVVARALAPGEKR
jgi:hypothetical protein